MITIKEEAVINNSQEKCFQFSHDYSIRYDWDNFIAESEILEIDVITNAPKKVWVKDRRGLTMTVVYTSYKPPKNASMKMISGPFFFSKFSGAWVFKKKSQNKTDTIFSYSFELKFWLIPFISNKIVKYLLRKEIKQRLNDFKEYCEIH